MKIQNTPITQQIRPIKIMFFVDINEKSNLLKATTLNTILWGGIFNPLIYDLETDTISLINEFDPDVIVNLTTTDLNPLIILYPNINFVSEVDVFSKVHNRYELNIGFNMLAYYSTPEIFKNSVNAKNFISESSDKEWELYSSFAFGSFKYTPLLTDDYKSFFSKAFVLEEVLFTPDMDRSECFSPINGTKADLSTWGTEGSLSSHVLFIGDKNSPTDLVEFWNIRATGRHVFFCPSEKIQTWSKDIDDFFIKGNYPLNQNLLNTTTVLKSHSLDKSVFDEATKLLNHDLNKKYTLQSFTPSYSNGDDTYVGDIKAKIIKSNKHQTIYSLYDGERFIEPTKLLQPIDSKYTERNNFLNWAVDIKTGDIFDSKTLLIPQMAGMEKVIDKVFNNGHPSLNSKFSKSEISIFANRQSTSLYISPVNSFYLWQKIFALFGLKIKISDPGKYLSKIISTVGGDFHFSCRIFKIRAIRDILNTLSNGSSISKAEMCKIFYDETPDAYGKNWDQSIYSDLIIKSGYRKINFTVVFDFLIEKRIIRPGLEFKCKNCSKKDWYHVSDFNEQFKCHSCLETQNINLQNSPDWRYKANGIFQIENSAQGSISVIPALWRVLHTTSMERSIYLPSILVESEDGKFKLELDYLVYSQDHTMPQPSLIIGEEKNFTNHDNLDKLIELKKRISLDNLFFAISTLKDNFSDIELNVLKKLQQNDLRIIPMTRLDVDPYELFERFKEIEDKSYYGLKRLSKNLIQLNINKTP